jgi:DNA-binding MarR family transcriptional regulator
VAVAHVPADDAPAVVSVPGGLRGHIGYLLKYAHLGISERVGRALAPLGVCDRELALLTVLSGTGTAGQQPAAQLLGIDRTSMVNLVHQMTRKGLLVRVPDAEDGRRNLLQLTAAGRHVQARGECAYRHAEREFLATLDTGDADRFTVLLRRLLIS